MIIFNGLLLFPVRHNSIVAPSHAHVGQSILVFSVFRLKSDAVEYYHLASSSGYRQLGPAAWRLMEAKGQTWISLYEAREMGRLLESSAELVIPEDLGFLDYEYSDPVVVLLVKMPLWSEGEVNLQTGFALLILNYTLVTQSS